MKVYLAGPMSGLPGDNYDAFDQAAARLRAAGYEVVSPAEGVATEEERRMSLRMGEEFRATSAYAGIVERTVAMVEQCDAVCLLTGWHRSAGALREQKRAVELGIPLRNVDQLIMAGPPPQIRWTGDEECAPVRGYAGDAGLDLVVSKDTIIAWNQFVDVPLGISVELPPGMWAMLTGRSSTLRRRGLLVSQGIIDNGYRGPLFAGVQNLGEYGTVVKRGERIAQLIPFRLETPGLELRRVAALGDSDRGTNGFGSTGT